LEDLSLTVSREKYGMCLRGFLCYGEQLIYIYIYILYIFHVQSDNHMRINSSDNRKHMFDLTTQANNSTLQAGLIVIKMKLNTLSIINGAMIENVTISQQY